MRPAHVLQQALAASTSAARERINLVQARWRAIGSRKRPNGGVEMQEADDVNHVLSLTCRLRSRPKSVDLLQQPC